MHRTKITLCTSSKLAVAAPEFGLVSLCLPKHWGHSCKCCASNVSEFSRRVVLTDTPLCPQGRTVPRSTKESTESSFTDSCCMLCISVTGLPLPFACYCWQYCRAYGSITSKSFLILPAQCASPWNCHCRVYSNNIKQHGSTWHFVSLALPRPCGPNPREEHPLCAKTSPNSNLPQPWASKHGQFCRNVDWLYLAVHFWFHSVQSER